MTTTGAANIIGAGALRPNPALAHLAFLIGDWSTTGTHPMLPGEDLPGTTSFAWGEGGAFIIMRSQTDHRDFPDGVALFGSDGALGATTMCWFDERGVSRLCPVQAGRRWVSWHHDDSAFMQRVTITADANCQRMISKGEMARDGGAWGDDFSQVFLRGNSGLPHCSNRPT